MIPAIERLEELVEPSKSLNKEWRNDFNRYTNLVRAALAGVASLSVVVTPKEVGQQISDVGYVRSLSILGSYNIKRFISIETRIWTLYNIILDASTVLL